jgi:hypothetical protein
MATGTGRTHFQGFVGSDRILSVVVLFAFHLGCDSMKNKKYKRIWSTAAKGIEDLGTVSQSSLSLFTSACSRRLSCLDRLAQGADETLSRAGASDGFSEKQNN